MTAVLKRWLLLGQNRLLRGKKRPLCISHGVEQFPTGQEMYSEKRNRYTSEHCYQLANLPREWCQNPVLIWFSHYQAVRISL